MLLGHLLRIVVGVQVETEQQPRRVVIDERLPLWILPFERITKLIDVALGVLVATLPVVTLALLTAIEHRLALGASLQPFAFENEQDRGLVASNWYQN